MEKMNVIAPRGKTCPMEGPRGLIDDSGEIPVPNNHYYRSRIAAGDLLFKGHVGQTQPPIATRKSTVDRKIRGGAS